jgi:membrane protein implicated in regulation of membrane protease activity
MDFLFIHFSYWWGLAIGALLIAVEYLVPSGIFLWMGISGILISLVLIWSPAMPLLGVLVAWIVLSAGSVWLAKHDQASHS